MSQEMRTHPAADMLPMQTDDEFAALVELIAEHGQQRPIVVDDEGRIVDGRNRWKACEVLGIQPITEPLGDRDPWELSENENGANRSLSTGQKAMRRAVTLAAQGKRKDGRWEYGLQQGGESGSVSESEGWQKAVRQAGAIIDVRGRAEALDPDDGRMSAGDRDFYMGLPDEVLAGSKTIAAAYREAADFDAKAALAEAALYRPLTDALNHLEELADDIDRYLPLPEIDADLQREHKDRLDKSAKRFASAAALIRNYKKKDDGK